MSIQGIDVSHYQLNIDWGKVAASGIKFCIMKAMYESTHKPDEFFEKNYQGCVANGLRKGAYIFIGSRSIQNPKEDAEDFLNILDGRTLEYGIWLDAESTKVAALGKQKITEILLAEAEVFERAKYHVGIYTNPNWYKNYLDISRLKDRYPFWVARYPAIDTGVMSMFLSPKGYAEAWQYSSKGSVPGIKGNVDLDVDYTYDKFIIEYIQAEQVLAGKWGSANTKPTRKERLEAAGYDYDAVQRKVNAIYKARTSK